MHWYFHYYCQYAREAWQNMTPMQYGFLLVSIAAAGYALMKTNFK